MSTITNGITLPSSQFGSLVAFVDARRPTKIEPKHACPGCCMKFALGVPEHRHRGPDKILRGYRNPSYTLPGESAVYEVPIDA